MAHRTMRAAARSNGWALVAVLTAGCSHSPMAPAPSTITLSGTVTATNGGQVLPAAAIDVAGQHVITDSGGQYRVTVPSGRYTLMISGQGLLPHTLAVDVQASRGQALEAISETSGFDLGFYRQFVRDGWEAPNSLEALRRWTTAPSFLIQSTDDAGAAMDPDLLAAMRAAIAAVVPAFTGNRFVASFGSGVPVRFTTAKNGLCGEAPVGPNAAFILIHYTTSPCNLSRSVSHETGHVLGFWHTDSSNDLMFPGGTVTTPSARERYHAAIAYQRPVGNLDPDTDP